MIGYCLLVYRLAAPLLLTVIALCLQYSNGTARIVSSWFYSEVILKITSRCLYGIGAVSMCHFGARGSWLQSFSWCILLVSWVFQLIAKDCNYFFLCTLYLICCLVATSQWFSLYNWCHTLLLTINSILQLESDSLLNKCISQLYIGAPLENIACVFEHKKVLWSRVLHSISLELSMGKYLSRWGLGATIFVVGIKATKVLFTSVELESRNYILFSIFWIKYPD